VTVAAEADLALTEARRRIRSHGGDLRLVEVDHDGAAEVEFIGACRGCPALAFTFVAVVEPTLLAVDGVSSVTTRQGRFSRHVADRVRRLTVNADTPTQTGART
jgi:Fe-S cluster biogenesis protein NfuA